MHCVLVCLCVKYNSSFPCCKTSPTLYSHPPFLYHAQIYLPPCCKAVAESRGNSASRSLGGHSSTRTSHQCSSEFYHDLTVFAKMMKERDDEDENFINALPLHTHTVVHHTVYHIVLSVYPISHSIAPLGCGTRASYSSRRSFRLQRRYSAVNIRGPGGPSASLPRCYGASPLSHLWRILACADISALSHI